MPQVEASTWFITVLSSSITLFILMQLKISSQNFPLNPTTKTTQTTKIKNPWELTWTKIYSPLLLPQQ